MVERPPLFARLDMYAAVFPSGLQVKNPPAPPAMGVLGDPESGVRTRPLLASTYERVAALTNCGAGTSPKLLTVLGWFMSVRSLTTTELLPCSVTTARLRTGVGAGRGDAVAEEKAEGEAEGDGAFATGVGELQAEAISAVIISARIHTAAFMSLQQ
jgi:hypothetical protein